MDHIIGRIVAPIILIILMIVVPLVWVATGIDNTQRSAADRIVNMYASEVRSTGVITKENYEAFLRNLQKTGEIYDINIVHESVVAVPEGKGKFSKSFKSYGKEDILAYVEGYGDDLEPGTADDTEGADYRMKTGDYITITATSVNGSVGTRYLDAANGDAVKGIKINATAGGMVGNKK